MGAGHVHRSRSNDAVQGSNTLKCRDPGEMQANNWGQITAAIRASTQQKKTDGKNNKVKQIVAFNPTKGCTLRKIMKLGTKRRQKQIRITSYLSANVT